MTENEQAANPGWQVYIASSAVADFQNILDFAAERDGFDAAHALLRLFEEKKNSLVSFPFRGHVPPELERLKISDFREIHCGVYRLIYQAVAHERRVYVHVVFDGRRYLDEIMHRRFLRI